ncbi:MAG: hypothetical protein QM765_12275 [Myxococcales bacterium]
MNGTKERPSLELLGAVGDDEVLVEPLVLRGQAHLEQALAGALHLGAGVRDDRELDDLLLVGDLEVEAEAVDGLRADLVLDGERHAQRDQAGVVGKDLREGGLDALGAVRGDAVDLGLEGPREVLLEHRRLRALGLGLVVGPGGLLLLLDLGLDPLSVDPGGEAADRRALGQRQEVGGLERAVGEVLEDLVHRRPRHLVAHDDGHVLPADLQVLGSRARDEDSGDSRAREQRRAQQGAQEPAVHEGTSRSERRRRADVKAASDRAFARPVPRVGSSGVERFGAPARLHRPSAAVGRPQHLGPVPRQGRPKCATAHDAA